MAQSSEAPKKEEKKVIRQPIVTVLGHIDHGKTTLLDFIRGTLVQKREAAGITQHIGASFFPIKNVIEFCGPKYKNLKVNLPGLLFIDTPGHAAFMNLRRRGGAVADIAILVVEVTSGTMPTTWEAVRILRDRKVPFIIAANKIDLINGWKSHEKGDFLESYKNQADYVQQDLDQRIYQLIGNFIDEGFAGCERYDRIDDFTKHVAIVPISAKTGEGIPNLLLVLIGLVQQYLQKRIRFSEGPAKGVVLEVKQDPQLGTSLDCLIYDGILKKNNQIVLGGIPDPVKTKVRALLVPHAMDEIRDPEDKFQHMEEVYAAAGIKILAPEIQNVVAGAPLRAIGPGENADEIMAEIKKELEEIQIETDEKGVILKADSLGSLEAIVKLFSENNVKVRTAKVGTISKQDIMEAVAVREYDEYNACVLGFNVKILKDAQEEANNQHIRIFTNEVIYRLMEEFKEYYDRKKEEEKIKAFSEIIFPGKAIIIPDYIFRRSDPAVVGIRVELGKFTPKQRVVTQDGETVGTIQQLQENNESLKVAEAGKECAISIKGAVIGRNLKPEDTLYIYSPESHIRLLNGKYKSELKEEDMKLIKEYIKVMRKKYSPFWGA